ncbi:MAG: acetolactate synthase-1/3 small subunit [Rhodothermales bacterium]|jgi:acetolactate synthase-1/3 small subunit
MLSNQQHTISLLVNNKPGVLIRISLVFARRGYNIDSLVVSPAKEARYSRMTITASGDIATLEQIIKQLNKLVDVLHATDHTDHSVVERELALVKVACTSEDRAEILQIAEHFKCDSVDLSQTTLMMEVTGSSAKLDAMMIMLRDYDVNETVRTGKILMARGSSET